MMPLVWNFGHAREMAMDGALEDNYVIRGFKVVVGSVVHIEDPDCTAYRSVQ
jgi:hypothetical protein